MQCFLENELWRLVSRADNSHCPFYNCCDRRRSGAWCLDDHYERLVPLLTDVHNDIHFSNDCAPYRSQLMDLLDSLVIDLFEEWQITELPVSSDLISLADKQRKIEVRLVPMRVTHGALWHIDNGWIIHINENLPPSMRRVTLFHEAFHILAHRNTMSVIETNSRYNKGRFSEILADFFAIHMLMPDKLLLEEWKKTRDVKVMSDTFDVPPSLMDFCLAASI